MRDGFLGGRADAIALIDDRRAISYGELADRVAAAAHALGGAAGLGGARVVLIGDAEIDWVIGLLAAIAAGGVAVPLSLAYPATELAWFAADAEASIALVGEAHAELAAGLGDGRTVHLLGELVRAPGGASVGAPGDAALILYTSGTTGRPKGAVLGHAQLAVHTRLLREAWAIDADDRMVHALPLHHLHGLVVGLLTALSAGATIRLLPRFDAARVIAELVRHDATLWMAVPTMYHRLRERAAAEPPLARELARAAAGLRLATSGSAALPVSLAEWWAGLHGAIPLERFGMTEIGIACGNPLASAARRPGSVGLPLATVETRLVDGGAEVATGPAELWVRGPSVFAGYWRRDDATRAAFSGGWFVTGDVAERGADGYVRLLGRTSVDILKSGGYKISALEIEEVLRDHDAIAEVAVIGLPDEALGERVVAVVVARAGATVDGEAVRAWARTRLASYKVPRAIVVTAALPHNAMGKVVKPELIRALRGA